MIEKDSEMLRQAMVNMSVYDILHNPESVFTKLIGYLVDTAPLSVWQDEYLFNEFIIKNLAKL
jgi:dynactin complex subunit